MAETLLAYIRLLARPPSAITILSSHAGYRLAACAATSSLSATHSSRCCTINNEILCILVQ